MTDKTITDWQTGPHPKDGSLIYVQHFFTMKWTPYKPTSPQRKKGIMGRWQQHGDYGWENSWTPESPWKRVGNPGVQPFARDAEILQQRDELRAALQNFGVSVDMIQKIDGDTLTLTLPRETIRIAAEVLKKWEGK